MPDTRYFPPKSLTRTLSAIVAETDSDFNADRAKELEFDMSNGRKFYRPASQRFPYNED